MLMRDTLLRTLLCEDVAARDAAADAAGVRMLLRDTELRTLLCEDVAARYTLLRTLLLRWAGLLLMTYVNSIIYLNTYLTITSIS